MKLVLASLLAISLLPTFASAETEWETVRCRYKRNRIPDDDRGTWCRHFFTCVDQGKRAFILYRDGSMDRLCCDARRQNCTDTYSGS